MFERACFVFALLLFASLAQAQISPQLNQNSVCDLSGVNSNIAVLLNQNNQLRELISTTFDTNTISAQINERVDAQIAKDSKTMREQFLMLFIAEALVIIGFSAIFYWFIGTKIKRTYLHAGKP